MLIYLLLLHFPLIAIAQTCYDSSQVLTTDPQNQDVRTMVDSLAFINNITDSNKLFLDATGIADKATVTIDPFTHDTIQQIYCTNIVSCLQSVITFYNNTYCNILCNDLLSCGSANINIDSCSHIHLICNGDQSCDSANITITNASHSNITIDCGAKHSCPWMRINIIGNTSSTQISCIDEDACREVRIFVDHHKNVVLNMYTQSFGLIFDNNIGYQTTQRTDEFVECFTKSKYIPWDPSLNNTDIATLIQQDYTDSVFPCIDVTMFCEYNNTCKMDWIVNPDFNFTPTPAVGCHWIPIYDIIDLYCAGTCETSPTAAPTAAPSAAPTFPTSSPSNAPSGTPTAAPSAAPTGESISPTNAPSIAPTGIPTPAPTDIPTGTPTGTPTPAPTFSPTEIPSAAPTGTPTQAPTRDPTSSKYNFDATMKIVYVLTNLTDKNIDFILNNTLNHAIEHIQEIIESHYFSTKFLNKYEFFTIIVDEINGVNYKNDAQFTKDIIVSNMVGDIDEYSIHFKSKIEFDYEQHANYIVPISKDTDWYQLVSETFQKYFNNSGINFFVYNADQLNVIKDEEEGSGLVFWTLNGILVICLLIGVAAYIYNKYSPNWLGTFKSVDDAAWTAVVLYGVQIYDMVSDINLTTEMFVAISDEKAHVPGEDAAGIVDTPKEWMLLISGWASLLFIVLPYILNVAAAIKIPRLTKKFVCTRNYFEKHRLIFIFLVVFSGGAYPALALVCSNVFGLDVLNAGLSRFELESLVKIRLFTSVLSENVPQLIAQIMYSYAIGGYTQNTILAFCTSVASIIASMMIYCMNRSDATQKCAVDCYLEIKKYKDDNFVPFSEKEDVHHVNFVLSKDEKKHIKKQRGVTLCLAKKLAAIYGIDISDYQIPYVNIRNDNFIIRVVHQVHKDDLGMRSISMDRHVEIKTDEEREEEITEKCEIFCESEFRKHKREIKPIIFEHYNVDSSNYKIYYHSKYPNKSPDQIEQENITELVRVNTMLDMKGTITHMDDGIGYDLLKEYKEDLLRGIDIIQQEAQNLPDTQTGVTSLQRNRFVKKLADNDIKHFVIEDILSVATKAGTLKKHERRGSDLGGSSDEEMSDFI